MNEKEYLDEIQEDIKKGSKTALRQAAHTLIDLFDSFSGLILDQINLEEYKKRVRLSNMGRNEVKPHYCKLRASLEKGIRHS